MSCVYTDPEIHIQKCKRQINRLSYSWYILFEKFHSKTNNMKISDLKTGDILLFSPEKGSFISWAITFLTHA